MAEDGNKLNLLYTIPYKLQKMYIMLDSTVEFITKTLMYFQTIEQ